MNLVGIDPGKQGYAVLTNLEKGFIVCTKLRFTKDNILQPFIENFTDPIDMIILEKTMGRGGWGATQNYNFGLVSGQIIGHCRGLTITLVRPQSWQSKVCQGVPKTTTAKDRSLQTYYRLFPSDPLKLPGRQKADDNLIDAFLISIYGQMEFGNIKTFNFSSVQIYA